MLVHPDTWDKATVEPQRGSFSCSKSPVKKKGGGSNHFFKRVCTDLWVEYIMKKGSLSHSPCRPNSSPSCHLRGDTAVQRPELVTCPKSHMPKMISLGIKPPNCCFPLILPVLRGSLCSHFAMYYWQQGYLWIARENPRTIFSYCKVQSS